VPRGAFPGDARTTRRLVNLLLLIGLTPEAQCFNQFRLVITGARVPNNKSNVDGYNVLRYRLRQGIALKEPNTLPLPPAVFQILVALAEQDRHGYAIMQDVAARTDGRMKLSPGTLYGAIKRLLEEGLIVELGERPEDDDERRRYYRLTPEGRAAAQAEADRLTTLLRQARAAGLTPRRSSS
jgi:DNA-binding PadR family transcriptional regulator